MKVSHLKYYNTLHNIALAGAVIASFGFGCLISFNKRVAEMQIQKSKVEGQIELLVNMPIEVLTTIHVRDL